jgi:uncharacterized OB-fold protein
VSVGPTNTQPTGTQPTNVGPVLRDLLTAEFFDGTARGEFLLRRCVNGHFSEPKAQQCSTCGSTELSWYPAAGQGRVISFAVAHNRVSGGQISLAILVIVEFDEGPWWWSQVVGAAADEVAVGSRVQVGFERYDELHELVPVFTLVRAGS